MKRRFSPKKVLNYVMFGVVAYLAYKVFLKDNSGDPYGDRSWQHPRQVGVPEDSGKSGVKVEEKILRAEDVEDHAQSEDEVVRGNRKSWKEDKVVELEEERVRKEKAERELKELEARILRERQELAQELEQSRKEKERINSLLQEEKRLRQEAQENDLDLDDDEEPPEPQKQQQPQQQQQHQRSKPEAANEAKKAADEAKKSQKTKELDMEQERERRRREFFKLVAKNKAEFNEEDESDFHERDDFLNFVTALSPTTFRSGLQLIDSVQRFFPKQGIGVYDLGLTREQRGFLKTVCSVTLHELWLMAWPSHIRNATNNLWRPILLQLALSEFGHFIYVEPELVLKNSNIKPYIQHSRRKGVVLVGKRKKYSSFVVTHPEMLFYLSVDVRKLQKLPHVELSMVLMHSTTTVRQRFMNLLIACTVEEWCIAPIGSKRNCDHRLFAGSKKWADCHRYDESAINVLLKHWNQYQEDKYFTRDVITTHYDGTDVRDVLKKCNKTKKKVDL